MLGVITLNIIMLCRRPATSPSNDK